tara:strand:+ start:646 stop:1068 length:423 start_codon:yes stop_codon:yes gene_type:complete
MSFCSASHFSYAENWRWENFSPEEIACRGTGKLFVSEPFLDMLQELRTALDRPLRISSGYRSPEHNAKVSSTGTDGPHTTGKAVDILCHGRDAYSLLAVALPLGFKGIGIQQKGPLHNRFIHLDVLTTDDGMVRPTIWSY